MRIVVVAIHVLTLSPCGVLLSRRILSLVSKSDRLHVWAKTYRCLNMHSKYMLHSTLLKHKAALSLLLGPYCILLMFSVSSAAQFDVCDWIVFHVDRVKLCCMRIALFVVVSFLF